MYVAVTTKDQIKRLASLAKEIWLNYFGPMMDVEILEKVIDSIQSEAAIAKQIQEGYIYYLICSKDSPVGYFAYKINFPKDELFLSKLYIMTFERGKGRGKKVMNFLEKVCRIQKITKLRLTVFHKNKSAVQVYKHQGFEVIGPIVRDLGDGIIIDDYEMGKTIRW